VKDKVKSGQPFSAPKPQCDSVSGAAGPTFALGLPLGIAVPSRPGVLLIPSLFGSRWFFSPILSTLFFSFCVWGRGPGPADIFTADILPKLGCGEPCHLGSESDGRIA